MFVTFEEAAPASQHALARALSQLLGVGYLAAWSSSFYFQPYINFRRKSVTGLALDYFTLNVLGFSCYTISSVAFLFSPTIREQYAQRHHGSEPTVKWNDLAFAGHALLLSVITFSQFFFWGYARHRLQRLSYAMKFFLLGCFAVAAVSMLAVDDVKWQSIDVIYTLQWIKLLTSCIKYIPQAHLNFKRKSTVGWSIENILLDMSGGVLSLAQLLIDASLQKDWSALIGNPVKFYLAQIAIVFDILFIFQHYVLYRQKNSGRDDGPANIEEEGREPDGERASLLRG